MILNPHIFRAYDIRGRAFIDFDEDGFFVVGTVFGKHIAKKFNLEKPRIFVSGDGRISMGQLWPAVVSGLEAAGCEITWGGVLPTPVNYFAFHEGDFDGAIQITASHNPPDENGLKFTDRKGSVAGEELQIIRKLAECGECHKTEDFGECAEGCDVIPYSMKYETKLKEIVPRLKKQRIIIDCGNAVPGILYPEILRNLGLEVGELFCDMNTTFPNHQPDPEEDENLSDLIKKMSDEKADFGVAFDGDGDRLGIVLSNGKILEPGQILYVLAADFLSRNPKEKIVVEVMTSATAIEKIEALGGKTIMCPTGHSYIEQTMHKEKALFGGEQSGHYMFGENFYGHDDALLAILKFLQATQENPKLLKEITEDWPEIVEYSKKFAVEDEKKFEILKKVILDIKGDIDPSREGIKIISLDGLRIDFGEGEWGIIRCSNTSPKILIRIQAKDKKSLEEKKEIFVGNLKKHLGKH